jgi:hypothetical protein
VEVIMPTNEQRMSPLLRRLRKQIGEERGFACFQEQVSVEQVVFAYAFAVGRPVSEVLNEWAGIASKQEPPKRPMRDLGPQPEDVPHGWPDDDSDDDDDSPEEPPTILCPTCRGLGTDKSGAKCSACNGTGRVAAPGVDDDWPDEKESRYEWQAED